MSDSLLTVLILLVFLVIAIVSYFIIKKFENKRASKNKKAKFDDKPRLKLNLPFLNAHEVKFLAVFQNSLPSEYVAFPKVPMKSIVKPDGSLVVFNEVENDLLDIVVFLKSKMQPVLVVDLLDPSKGDKNITKYSDFDYKSLKSVNLPVLVLTLDHDYEKLELLNQFLDKMDPLSIAEMKKSK